jgi:AcrR family transcriptional regulator
MSIAPLIAPSRLRFSEDSLLDAARDVFDKSGYHGAQVAEIALHAGTTKPTLYARLGGKEEIYRRVVEREALVLKAWFYDVYERAEDLPLSQFANAGVEPIFRFARERRAGFDMLFRSELGGTGRKTSERGKDEVIEQLTGAIVRRVRRFGRQLSWANAGVLAAAATGVALQVCEYAIDHDHDLEAASTSAAHFIDSAFRALDYSRFAS